MQFKIVVLAVVVGFLSAVSADSFIVSDIGAYHFHTFFFETNEARVDEVLSFRRKARELINDGTLAACSLNQIRVGWWCIYPVSQYEMCCNKTSFAAANAFHVQNHGNLSVSIHPLTIYDLEDHLGRVSWLGQPVVMDTEDDCIYPVLPKPRPCPVYPDYPDTLPTGPDDYFPAVPGTDDYIKNFDLLTGDY